MCAAGFGPLDVPKAVSGAVATSRLHRNTGCLCLLQRCCHSQFLQPATPCPRPCRSFWKFLAMCLFTVNLKSVFRHLDATVCCAVLCCAVTRCDALRYAVVCCDALLCCDALVELLYCVRHLDATVRCAALCTDCMLCCDALVKLLRTVRHQDATVRCAAPRCAAL